MIPIKLRFGRKKLGSLHTLPPTACLDLCGGDAIKALRITLIANAFLTEENDRLKTQVSRGFTPI